MKRDLYLQIWNTIHTKTERETQHKVDNLETCNMKYKIWNIKHVIQSWNDKFGGIDRIAGMKYQYIWRQSVKNSGSWGGEGRDCAERNEGARIYSTIIQEIIDDFLAIFEHQDGLQKRNEAEMMEKLINGLDSKDGSIKVAARGGGLGSRPIFKKFNEPYAPS